MTSRELRGQPFFSEWQYRDTCETCGLPGLYVCALDKMPARLRRHCPWCQVTTWHRLSALPEALR